MVKIAIFISFKKSILVFFIFFSFFSYSQKTITGKVIDANTQQPIKDANVFFDGTSIGTLTKTDGSFHLAVKKPVNTSLLITFVGYKSWATQKPIQKDTLDLKVIKLEKKEENLEEVFLETDPWSRERKMAYFKEYFLGKSENVKNCKILNEDQVKLRFSPSKKQLTAWCEVPLEIENKYLSYRIRYELVDFKINFNKTDYSNIPNLKVEGNLPPSSYKVDRFAFLGTSFFEELNPKKTKRKFKKRREKEFKGSFVHFMRTLAAKELEEKSYRIFHNSFQTQYYKYLKVTPKKDYTEVKFDTGKLSITFADFIQTDLTTATGEPLEFKIDTYGNIFPYHSIYITGAMAEKRVASLLPLDYGM